MTFRLSRRAGREIERIDRWWHMNRPAAPDAFVDELADAIERIVSSPSSGTPWGSRQNELVRRVLLPTTSHFVYYAVDDDEPVVVLAVRSTWRGSGPRFGGRRS